MKSWNQGEPEKHKIWVVRTNIKLNEKSVKNEHENDKVYVNNLVRTLEPQNIEESTTK